MAFTPSDEQPHARPVGVDAWSEAWTFDLVAPDAGLAAFVRFTRHLDDEGRGQGWYQAMVAGRDRQLLAVVDHAVPFRTSPLEVRTTGLWADHVCETAFDHWTIGLEAFALGVDDPLELYGRQHGDLVPLGFDLEWEATGPVLPGADGVGPVPAVAGYLQPCQVTGEILVGAAEIDFDGVGSRGHAWGPIDWVGDEGWSARGVLEGGTWWVVRAGPDGAVATEVTVDGTTRTHPVEVDLRVDGDGLPRSAAARGAGVSVGFETIAPAPVAVEVDGRAVRRPWALVRLRDESTGGTGVGWIEVRGTPVRGRLAG